jgi:Arc/MetJ-type ribon-helix-helix transcriptional regulator
MAEAKQTRQIFVRMPEDLVIALDRYVETMKARQPGTTPSRSDAIRSLLYKALTLMEEAEEERRRGPRDKS